MMPFPRLGQLLVAFTMLLVAASVASAFEQRAYIWQRSWTPALQRDLSSHGGEFAALDVLAAEIAWRGGAPTVTHVSPAWPTLAHVTPRVALVVRIGATASDWRADSAATRAVVATCARALAAACGNGLEPAELQLDFDAATARLAAYRELLRAVRREVRPPRLTITALPTWTRSPEFAALVVEADGFVLQVHSLEKPVSADAAFTLCDSAKARAWIERAAAFDRPFRVALPAYGYRLVFDAAGKFAGLEAEGEPREWPAGFTTRVAFANSTEIAALVQQLLASPPAHCEGIAWFRFPTAGDELAWSWPTLRTVMLGRTPHAQLTLVAQPAANGTLELLETNSGDASAEPVAFCLEWRDARALAVDGLAGWRVERDGPLALTVRPPPHRTNGLLRPGESLHVGWLRLDRAAEVTAVPLH